MPAPSSRALFLCTIPRARIKHPSNWGVFHFLRLNTTPARLLQVLRKTDYADRDQVDRDDVVESSGHKQNENARDECNQRIQ